MKQIYFIFILLTTLATSILSTSSAGITFAQEKNEASETEDYPLIITPEQRNQLKQTIIPHHMEMIIMNL